LKEQIISERPIPSRERFNRRALLLAAASIAVLFIVFRAGVLWQQRPNDDTFANYRARMVKTALRGYAMDLESSNPEKIRDYLAQQSAAQNYKVPPGLLKVTPTGCAIENWQGAKVAMLCFRAGAAAPAGGKSDIWLFVVDSDSVKDAPAAASPEFAKVNKLMTATWTDGGKLYILGAVGDQQLLRQWL